MPDTDITAAARALRPELHGMLGDPQHNELELQVDELLSRADAGEPVDDELLIALTRNDAVRERLNELLPSVDGERSGYSTLAGFDDPSDFDVFECPEPACDYSFPLFEAGEVPGVCPRHLRPLVLRG
jgi:hypothetical protein